MRLFLVVLIIGFHASFVQATEPSFKFSFGSKLGNIPFEINKTSKNIKTQGMIKLNSWTLSPKFSSFVGSKEKNSFKPKKDFKEIVYIKINFKF